VAWRSYRQSSVLSSGNWRRPNRSTPGKSTGRPAPLTFSEEELRALQARITDPNFRIFADAGGITVMNNTLFVRGTDIQKIFAQLDVDEATHAFYLGKELARASLAVTLGKTYRQEGALSWGYLTPPDEEAAGHVRLTQRARRPPRSSAHDSRD